MYTLYIGNKNYSSWSLRPWILLTELGIAFEEKLVPFDDGGSREKFRAFSPNGLVPCLHDGDTVVWESLAIVEYLAEKHPGVWPEAVAARAWARAATAEMHAGFNALRGECPMTVGLRISAHQRSIALQQDLDRLDELWQQGFERFGGDFLTGTQFCAVDAFFCPVAYRVQTWGLPLSEVSAAYVERLLALPGMQAWTAAALTEPYREATHEAEFAALGELLRTGAGKHHFVRKPGTRRDTICILHPLDQLRHTPRQSR